MSQQYMTGASLSNRLWFHKNKIALTLRGDFVKNPGLYLAFSPSPVTPNDFTDAIDNDPNQDLTIYHGTATFDVMPNDFVTLVWNSATETATNLILRDAAARLRLMAGLIRRQLIGN